MRSNIRNLALSAAICSLFLAGCLTTTTTRGYNLDRMTQQKKAIVPGETTEEDVRRMLGSPSTESSYGGKSWYYVTSKTESVAFLKPKIVEQKVMVVAFDDSGVVRRVNEYDREDALVFKYNKDYTPTEGNDLSVLQQLLGNVGRFNSDPSSPAGPRMPRGGVDGY